MNKNFREHLRALGALIVTLSLGASLSGCSSFDFPSSATWPGQQVSSLENASAGSRFADTFVWSDRRQIEAAAWTAANAHTERSKITWKNADTGSLGSVRSGLVYLVGFNAGAEIEAPVGLDTSVLLESSAGDYIANTNVNIRLAPQMDGRKVTVLAKGTRVQSVGVEPVAAWHLVAARGKILGYVYGALLTRVGGGDILLAGGDIHYPKLCRELTYKIKFQSGTSDEWLNGVCRQGKKRWSVVGGRALEAAR